LLAFVREGKAKFDDIITYRLSLIKISDRYAVFKKTEDTCVKVALDPWPNNFIVFNNKARDMPTFLIVNRRYNVLKP